MKHFVFERTGDDLCKPNGRIESYKQCNVVEETEEDARIKAKLSDEYVLVKTFELSKEWK
jgi:hypothetical protein